MAYGIQITGNDGGGNYTVTDTANNLINYAVIAGGVGSSVTLGTGVTKRPLIFVNAKGVTDATGTSTLVDELSNSHNMQKGVLVTWDQSTRTAAFFTSKVLWQTDRFDSVNTSRSMKYFIAVDNNEVPTALHANDSYGLQIFTSGGVVAVDSRRFPTNSTFGVSSALPAGSATNTTITVDEDAYIEMSQTYATAAPQYGGTSRRFIQFGSTNIRYRGENIDFDPLWPEPGSSSGPFTQSASSNRPIQVASLSL
jgi:hypothetical protein